MPTEPSAIFYSWQSDTPSNLNRAFIEKALTAAIERLHADAELQPALRDSSLVVDKDTKGVSGSPPITQTILEKIEGCAAFVADLTFVGESLPILDKPSKRKRLIPNPNVLIEYGYAQRCHGHRRVITVMNTAFGECNSETLPFDLRHLRWPITYELSGSEEEGKKAVFGALVAKLAEALKLILTERGEPAVATVDQPFVPTPSTTDPSIYFDNVENFLPERHHAPGSPSVQVPNEGRAYLRVYPAKAVPPVDTEFEAVALASKGGLRPMGRELSGWGHDRNELGAIVFEPTVEGRLYHFTQLFLNREIWGVDAFALNATHCREFTQGRSNGYIASSYVEKTFVETLMNYLHFSRETLGLKVPLQVEAGLVGIKGYPIAVQHGMCGRLLQDHIVWKGTVQSDDRPAHAILEPFFKYVWAKCGVERPISYQDELVKLFGPI